MSTMFMDRPPREMDFMYILPVMSIKGKSRFPDFELGEYARSWGEELAKALRVELKESTLMGKRQSRRITLNYSTFFKKSKTMCLYRSGSVWNNFMWSASLKITKSAWG